MADDLAPIAFEYALRCSADKAFDAYTRRIGEWWDPRYSANGDTLETVVIQPLVGGRVFARHTDLGDHEWGEVVVFEPGRQLVHTFTLAQDPAHPSEVEVEFAPGDGDSCTMRLAHGGWNDANASNRQKFGDWPVILERYVALLGN
jgi:Activator of Hsp90 ATPase homolog 1-like protein